MQNIGEITSIATTVLITIFTGATAVIAWLVFRDQTADRWPAIFIEFRRYDNELSLKMTVRNRSNHPMKITNFHLKKPKNSGLLRHHTSFNGRRGETNVNEIFSRDSPPADNFEMDITLGSAGLGSDTASRLFIVRGSAMKPKLHIVVSVDPSDGASKVIQLSRKCVIPPDCLEKMQPITVQADSE